MGKLESSHLSSIRASFWVKGWDKYFFLRITYNLQFRIIVYLQPVPVHSLKKLWDMRNNMVFSFVTKHLLEYENRNIYNSNMAFSLVRKRLLGYESRDIHNLNMPSESEGEYICCGKSDGSNCTVTNLVRWVGSRDRELWRKSGTHPVFKTPCAAIKAKRNTR
jgi:hypothetical protein